MRPLRLEETSVLIGSILVLLTMLVSYIALVTFTSPAEAAAGACGREQFAAGGPPSCSSPWLRDRARGCAGETRGRMPAVD